MANQNKRMLAPHPRRRWMAATLVLASWLLSGGVAVQAGGGPENVLLVVNPRRVDSMTIANHYANLRQIPANNLYFLEWDGARDIITVHEFRTKILEPILREIEQRKLDQQIDYVVYSSGFPFAVDFLKDLPGEPEPTTGRLGSLTGMTYLYQQVLTGDPGYAFTLANQRSNYYEGSRTRAFSRQIAWQVQGEPSPSHGRSYLLSTMLGYTDGRGNSIDEVLAYLRRAAFADGTRPDGTIYLMKMDGEVRSSTRDPAFPQVLAALEQEGVKCAVMPGVLPSSRKDVLGAVVGRANLDWNKSLSMILPGAICEHLTSFGGDLRSTAGQTPFTEHLRYGASGSSGTVAEPYALQAKFPHPWMHVHYARGATLAEAFYLSLASPYQLLIVGDPLCRPWARLPAVKVPGLEAWQKVSGTIQLQPESTAAVPIREFRLYVDGRQIQAAAPGAVFQLDTTKLPDGHHEIRIVASEDSPIGSQGRCILPLEIDNAGRTIQAVAQTDNSRSRYRIAVESPGAKSIYLFHYQRPIGRVMGERGSIAVDAELCGRGPVQLAAVAVGGEDGQRKVVSRPVKLFLPDGVGMIGFPAAAVGR